jgi:hypothetical protein
MAAKNRAASRRWYCGSSSPKAKDAMIEVALLYSQH